MYDIEEMMGARNCAQNGVYHQFLFMVRNFLLHSVCTAAVSLKKHLTFRKKYTARGQVCGYRIKHGLLFGIMKPRGQILIGSVLQRYKITRAVYTYTLCYPLSQMVKRG